jgi:hypothetical protein
LFQIDLIKFGHISFIKFPIFTFVEQLLML